jgi:alkanesulfonate monooxygenase SsuD/methylene tetrahydromethanopterin reductase-like flavin-dependent oxidoreductase (luciferase family)
VVKKLWESWDYESLQGTDSATQGLSQRLQSPTPIDHAGKYYTVSGPLQVPRTPQHSPVIFQAGGSPEGRALAARTAEGVFTIALTLEEAREFYDDLKSRAVASGRRAEDLVIMPGVYVYLGSTEAEVKSIRDELFQKVPQEQRVRELASTLSVDPAELHLDEPIPEAILIHAQAVASRSSIKSVVALATEGRPTVRELLARSPHPGPHRVLIDVPERIADSLQEWFESPAADGFNVGNMTPQKLEEFVDNVIPILQRRSLYRTEYRGETLRSHYREDFETHERGAKGNPQ